MRRARRSPPSGKEAATIARSRSRVARPQPRARLFGGLRGWAARALGVWVFLLTSAACAELYLPPPDKEKPIVIEAGAAVQWKQGLYDARRLSGGVTLRQGATVVRARQAVVFTAAEPRPDQPRRVIAYVEGAADRPVVVELYSAGGARDDPPIARQQAPDWFGEFHTNAGVEWRSPPPAPAEGPHAEIVSRALARLRGGADDVRPAQFEQPLAPVPGPVVTNPQGFRRVQIFRRTDVGTQIEWRPMPDNRSIAVVTGGVNVVIDGVSGEGVPDFFGDVENIDLETDRAVVWTAGVDGFSGTNFEQQNEVPLEIYMEGNIVFRQGDRTVYADRMYYDVRRRTGVVLNAELLTPLPEVDGEEYRGLVRLKADVIRQLDASRFVASDAQFTTSRLEEPSYSLGSETVAFEDIQRPRVDPATGVVDYDHQRMATSQNNFVYVGGVPVFYWPTIATNLDEPSFYIDDLTVRNDDIFGFQFLTDLDVHQLLGSRAPAGTDWDLSLDYLDKRGFGYGTAYQYGVDSFAGFLGPAEGRADLWAIDDGGVDNLGFLRRSIQPEASYRGRAFWNHRQNVTDGLLEGWIAQVEVGWISDRTFLEQYYEAEWDDNKDQATGVRFRRLFDNQSFLVEANARVNDFFTQTQWLPRADHYLMGQELLGDSMTWFAHTSAGFADYKPASMPTSPDIPTPFVYFPWEANVSGERIFTRQELDVPISASPFKFVPFALGEFYHAGEDVNGQEVQRTYVHTGVRASVPFWAVNPAVRDPLFNLNGLAHKVVFDAEATYTDASENFDRFPLYDPLEDDSLEEMRRRFYIPAFASGLAGLYNAGTGAIDPRVDPRVYGIRSGMHGWVASPTPELVEDQTAVRLGMRHRLQTKRGAPGQERIIDWLTLDSNATWFPRENEDNFGEPFGLLDYDLQWHVGDRFTILSDGFADTFEDGLRTVSGGVRLNRPSRGNVYLGYRTVRGPFEADLIAAAVNYRMSPKWVGSASTVVDLGDAGNIGQTFLLSRIGESLIMSLGANVDQSKGNVGFSFFVEPRFLPTLGLTRRTGVDIPPPGLNHLE